MADHQSGRNNVGDNAWRYPPKPTGEQVEDQRFQKIFDLIKSWDIRVPECYDGYCGGNGSHVAGILNALDDVHHDRAAEVDKIDEGLAEKVGGEEPLSNELEKMQANADTQHNASLQALADKNRA